MGQAIVDNREKSRFELPVEGQVAFADYRRKPGLLVITYVEAPPALRGTGAAGRLMQGVAEQARAEGVKVQPICGYARAWLQRHKDFADVTA
jgi:predicted GNAT family acetyltransferase